MCEVNVEMNGCDVNVHKSHDWSLKSLPPLPPPPFLARCRYQQLLLLRPIIGVCDSLSWSLQPPSILPPQSLPSLPSIKAIPVTAWATGVSSEWTSFSSSLFSQMLCSSVR